MMIYLQMIETEEDKSKFEIVYIEYRDLMYHVAYEIVKNNEDAEDAVHFAFVKIAENIQKVGEPLSSKTKGFVIAIVEHKAIDMYRAKKRHPEVEYVDNAIGIEIDYTGSFELALCLTKLPERYRLVLTLKHRHGFTNAEIAKIMDITVSNAIKLEQRAKAKLWEIYTQEDK